MKVKFIDPETIGRFAFDEFKHEGESDKSASKRLQQGLKSGSIRFCAYHAQTGEELYEYTMQTKR